MQQYGGRWRGRARWHRARRISRRGALGRALRSAAQIRAEDAARIADAVAAAHLDALRAQATARALRAEGGR